MLRLTPFHKVTSSSSAAARAVANSFTRRSVATTSGGSLASISPLSFSSSSVVVLSTTSATTPSLAASRRHYFWNRKKETKEVELKTEIYDKEASHYSGKFLGVKTDAIMFYGKIAAVALSVYLVFYMFYSGYSWLASFSLAQVGRMGFMAGFWTCAISFSTFVQLKKRYSISPNAVYNQAIATVMRDEEVKAFLGTYPKTGNFRAYHAEGGFKLPLLRRIRAGSYELADLLGTKPQRMQMMFVLRSEKKEALVSCEVQKMHSRIFSSSYQFKSLAVHLRDELTKKSRSRVLLGKEEDVVYKGIINLGGGF